MKNLFYIFALSNKHTTMRTIFKATKRLNHLKLFSKIKQYDSESNFFEITQLINSLMGLLPTFRRDYNERILQKI